MKFFFQIFYEEYLNLNNNLRNRHAKNKTKNYNLKINGVWSVLPEGVMMCHILLTISCYC